MAEDRIDLKRIDAADLFPWTILFRAFRLACDPKKILFGAAGALLVSLGSALLCSFSGLKTRPTAPPPLESNASAEDVAEYHRNLEEYRAQSYAFEKLSEARRQPWQSGGEMPSGVFASVLTPLGWADGGIRFPASALLVLEPLRQLTLPARLSFSGVGATFLGLLLLFWTLAVWSLFGGAICRVSAVQLARNGSVGLREALRFAARRYLSFFSSPLLPFLAVVLVVLFCAVGGLLARVPVLDVLAGLVWFLALLAGFVVVAALFGLVLGWPLMYAAVAAEATESFDALSRSFSYSIGRPWHYLFYATLAALYGAIVMIFVVAFAHGLVQMSAYAVSFGFGEQATYSLYAFAPEAPGWRHAFGPASADAPPPTGTRYVAAVLVGFWTHLAFLGVVGFAYSFFWTEATAVYFLLRRDVDETDIDEVYLEEEEEEPFPTAAPTVPGPPKASGAETNKPGTPIGEPSLPIVDPPK